MLFSDRGTDRAAAHDGIIKEFRSTPEAVSALLSYANPRMQDESGVYNTVVTLKDLSRSITQPRKTDLNQFCDQAEKTSNRTKAQCDAFRRWLETR